MRHTFNPDTAPPVRPPQLSVEWVTMLALSSATATGVEGARGTLGLHVYMLYCEAQTKPRRLASPLPATQGFDRVVRVGSRCEPA